MAFPSLFYGEDPSSWLSSMEEFFEVLHIEMENYVEISVCYLRGKADLWAKKNEELILQRDWCAFSYHLLWEFDPTVERPEPEEVDKKDEEERASDPVMLTMESVQEEEIKTQEVLLVENEEISSSGERSEAIDEADDLPAGIPNSLLRTMKFMVVELPYDVEYNSIHIQGNNSVFQFHAHNLFDEMLARDFPVRVNTLGVAFKVFQLKLSYYKWFRESYKQFKLLDVTLGRLVVHSQYGQWNYPYQMFDEMLEKAVSFFGVLILYDRDMEDKAFHCGIQQSVDGWQMPEFNWDVGYETQCVWNRRDKVKFAPGINLPINEVQQLVSQQRLLWCDGGWDDSMYTSPRLALSDKSRQHPKSYLDWSYSYIRVTLLPYKVQYCSYYAQRHIVVECIYYSIGKPIFGINAPNRNTFSNTYQVLDFLPVRNVVLFFRTLRHSVGYLCVLLLYPELIYAHYNLTRGPKVTSQMVVINSLNPGQEYIVVVYIGLLVEHIKLCLACFSSEESANCILPNIPEATFRVNSCLVASIYKLEDACYSRKSGRAKYIQAHTENAMNHNSWKCSPFQRSKLLQVNNVDSDIRFVWVAYKVTISIESPADYNNNELTAAVFCTLLDFKGGTYKWENVLAFVWVMLSVSDELICIGIANRKLAIYGEIQKNLSGIYFLVTRATTRRRKFYDGRSVR